MEIAEEGEVPRQATIWLLATYGALAAGAFAYFVSLQLGWRPPRALPWDAAASMVQTSASGLAAWLACVGVGTTLAEPIRRKWLAEGVLFAGVLVGGMIVLSTLNLGPQSTAPDVVRAVILSVAIGLGGAIGVALFDRATGLHRDEHSKAPIRTRQALLLGVLGLAIAVAVCELVTPRARNDGETVIVARFETVGAELEIAKHRVPLIGESTGVLRVFNGDRLNAVVLMADEWPALVKLVSSARMSPDSKWRVVGDLSDASPGHPTTLTLSVNDGLRFELASPGAAPVTYVVEAADVPRLRTALAAVDADI